MNHFNERLLHFTSSNTRCYLTLFNSISFFKIDMTSIIVAKDLIVWAMFPLLVQWTNNTKKNAMKIFTYILGNVLKKIVVLLNFNWFLTIMGSLDRAILTGFICRLCSEMHRIVIHIYGEEGIRLCISEKISRYLTINVSTVFFSHKGEIIKTNYGNCTIKIKITDFSSRPTPKNHLQKLFGKTWKTTQTGNGDGKRSQHVKRA